MTIVTENQPDGTPTWIDLGIPDLDRGMKFYRALFGWDFEPGPAEFGRYTMAYAGAGGLPRWRRLTRRRTGGTSTWPLPTATPRPRRCRRPAAPW